jgi:hypothetical protein
LTWQYDPNEVPEGLDEKYLCLARYDATAAEWVQIATGVDSDKDTITAQIGHFSLYAIVAPVNPAAFLMRDLVITPTEVGSGEGVTISAVVENNGDLAGNYGVDFKIDDVVIASKQLTLAGHTSKQATFVVNEDAPGTHTAALNDLSYSFAVKPVTAPDTEPAAAPPDESIQASTPVNLNLIMGLLAVLPILGLAAYSFLGRRTRPPGQSS